MRITKSAVAATGAIALLAATAAPALAAPHAGEDIFVGTGSAFWTWAEFTEASLYGAENDVWNDDLSLYGSWDYYATVDLISNGTDLSTPVGCSDPADLTEATDGSGDMILTCDPVSIDNGDGAYEARTEMRFYADGQTVRKRIIVTNTAEAPLVGQVVSIYWDSYFDEETSVSGSTTGGLDDFAANYGTVPATELTADDYFAVTDDRLQNENSPVTVYAFGSAGAAVPQSNNVTDGFVSGGIGNGGDEQYSYYELPSIAPGETVEIVVLNKVFHFDPETTAIGDYNSWQTGTWAAAQLAWADSSLQSGTDVVYAGIENRDAVLNWTPAAAEEPELAETGADQGLVAGAGAIALVAIAAGALTVVARRRSQCA